MRVGLGLGNVDENFELESILSGGATPSYMDTSAVSAGGGGYNWGNWFDRVSNTGLSVFRDIYGGAQPGTFIRTPQGGIIQRLPEGQANVGFTSFPSMGNSNAGDIILYGGLGIAGLLLLSKMLGENSNERKH